MKVDSFAVVHMAADERCDRCEIFDSGPIGLICRRWQYMLGWLTDRPTQSWSAIVNRLSMTTNTKAGSQLVTPTRPVVLLHSRATYLCLRRSKRPMSSHDLRPQL